MLQEREQFTVYLRRHGVRLTGERLALFEEIYRQHGHLDADALPPAVRERGHGVSRAPRHRTRHAPGTSRAPPSPARAAWWCVGASCATSGWARAANSSSTSTPASNTTTSCAPR